MHKELQLMHREVRSFMESVKPANPELINDLSQGVDVIMESWFSNLFSKKKEIEKPESFDLETESPIGTLVEKGSDRWTTADKDIDKAFVDGIINKIEYLINQGEGATLDYLFKKLDAVRPEFEKRETYSRHSAKDDAFVKSMVESLTEDDLEVYTLPLLWSKYLLEGKDDGLNREVIRDIKSFLSKNNLAHCIDVSEDTEFSDNNDANSVAGETAKFTFTKMDFEEFSLPAYWAAPLINGDFDGLEDDEIAEIEKFLHRNRLGGCLGVSDFEEFAPRNAANNLVGEVAMFKFTKLGKGGYEDQAQEPTSFVGLESIGDIIPEDADDQTEDQKPSYGETRKQLDALERLIEGAKSSPRSEYREKRHNAHLLLERIKGMEKSPKQEQRFENLDHRLAEI